MASGHPIPGLRVARMGVARRLHPKAMTAQEAVATGQSSYPIRKLLAKFLDEYNWHVAFGRDRTQP